MQVCKETKQLWMYWLIAMEVTTNVLEGSNQKLVIQVTEWMLNTQQEELNNVSLSQTVVLVAQQINKTQWALITQTVPLI